MKDYILVYSNDDLEQVGYTKLDFITDRYLRNSTSRYLFTLGGIASWISVKQLCIEDSTTKAEYVATS